MGWQFKQKLQSISLNRHQIRFKLAAHFKGASEHLSMRICQGEKL